MGLTSHKKADSQKAAADGGGRRHARRRSSWQQTQRRHRPPVIDSVSIQPRWIDNTGKLDQDVVTDVTATVTFGKATWCQDASQDQSPSLSAAVKRSQSSRNCPSCSALPLGVAQPPVEARKAKEPSAFSTSFCIRHNCNCLTMLLNHCQLCKTRNKKMKAVRRKMYKSVTGAHCFLSIFIYLCQQCFKEAD